MPVRPSSSDTGASTARVGAVRQFNRFYTGLIGALDEEHLRTPFTLAEGRVLFEIAHRDRPTASAVAEALRLDAGYLSRLLRRLERRRLLKRTRSISDGREHHLTLSASGRAAFHTLDHGANEAINGLLAPLAETDQRRLVEAMNTVATLLGAPPVEPGIEPALVIRPPRVGDMGWIVHHHAVLYAREYGWNERAEALFARVVADYMDSFDPSCERCWIAEWKGENAGSVFVARDAHRPGVAKLRMLIVDPSARGLGIGSRLVDECTRFARDAGYHTISLWTNSVLTAARKIYAAAGYHLVREEIHDTFGKPLTAETWEMSL